jgi:membrane-associated phospholipid phosphatase
VTAFWKISIHTTAISALSIFLVALFGWQVSLTLLMVPLVAWARVRTHSHTLRQTIGGALVGAVFMLVVFSFITI